MRQDQQHLVDELEELIDVADVALKGDSNDAEHDALVEIRTRIKLLIRVPTTTKTGQPRKERGARTRRERVPGGSLIPGEAVSPETLESRVDKLGLSERAKNCMSRANIATIGQLLQQAPGDLMLIRNFGMTTLNEVQDKLAKLGLKLAER